MLFLHPFVFVSHCLLLFSQHETSLVYFFLKSFWCLLLCTKLFTVVYCLQMFTVFFHMEGCCACDVWGTDMVSATAPCCGVSSGCRVEPSANSQPSRNFQGKLPISGPLVRIYPTMRALQDRLLAGKVARMDL